MGEGASNALSSVSFQHPEQPDGRSVPQTNEVLLLAAGGQRPPIRVPGGEVNAVGMGEAPLHLPRGRVAHLDGPPARAANGERETAAIGGEANVFLVLCPRRGQT